MNAQAITWIWRVGLAAFVILVVAIAFTVGRKTASSEQRDVATQHAAVESASATPQEFTCSMHPQVRSPNPNDKCPICGMDLIPVPADADDDDADAPVLRLSPRAAALMQVEVWPAERKHVHREVRLYGRLDYDETRLRTIAARYPGRLDRMFINFTGTSVAENEPLAEIYSPPLLTAQEELLQSIRALERISPDNRLARESAQATLEAARERLRLLGLTPMQIDEIETDRRVREHITIYAPLAGVVTQRHAVEGAYVETGEPIYSIADLSHLWVNLEVYETDLAWLRVGDEATFTTQAHPGEEFNGTVAFIDPVVDDRKRTVRVRIDVPNEEGRLKPGTFVRGVVHASVVDHPHAEHGPLVIPASAPLITGRRAVVYVQVPDEERLVFEGRQITLGPRAGGHYIVHDGLEEGELVVVHGAFRIDSELQIRGRPSMMQPEGGRPPTPGMHDHGHEHGAAPPVREVAAIAAPEDFVAALTPVYERYIALQVALSEDDLERSRQAAGHFHAAVTEVDAAMLGGDAAGVWRVLSARLRTEHEHVDHVDIEELRKTFHGWSNTMIETSQRFGYAGEAEIVLAHCPMAFDWAGADWLQVGRDIANPYFGATMYRCGEVRDRIEHHAPSDGGSCCSAGGDS